MGGGTGGVFTLVSRVRASTMPRARAASEPIINEESKEAFSNLAESAKRIWELHPKLVLGGLLVLVLMKDTLLRAFQFIVIYALVVAGLYATVPALETFDAFFKKWFLEEYMPKGGAIYRDRMKAEGKKQGFFSQLTASLSAAIHEVPEESSNKVLYELMVKHALPAAATYDLFCVKIKVVNIGSSKNPVKVGFLGACHNWFFIPYKIDEVLDDGLLEY